MTNGHGGPRRGAGGTISTIKISKERAKTLRALLRARPGGAYGHSEVARWVEDRIAEAWDAYDAEINRAVERAWEGEIL